MDRYRLYEEHRSSRIWELDFVRGFCIVLMILDHTLYDLAYIFRPQWFSGQKASGILYELTNLASSGYFPWILRDAGWWAAVFCFIFICGISCSFSHSNFKRGLRLAAVALLLTAVTYGLGLLLEQQNRFTIRFGILHMLAASILLYCLIKRKGFLFMMLLSIVCIAAGMYFMRFPLSGAVDYIALLVKSTTKFLFRRHFRCFRGLDSFWQEQPWVRFYTGNTGLCGPVEEHRIGRGLFSLSGAIHWSFIYCTSLWFTQC